MPQTINTNITSLNSQRNLNTSQSSLATSMERLSSGLRVNSSKDDAAGLAIADRMNAQIRGTNVAIRNANDGISLAQTAEGALATATDALQRMRELAVQAQNGSNGTGDRANLDTEYQQLSAEITRIATQTRFNGSAIVGANAGAQTFQVGANNGDTLTITTVAVATVTGDLTHRGATPRRRWPRSTPGSTRSPPTARPTAPRSAASASPSPTSRSPPRTSRRRAAGSWMPTSPPRPPTWRGRRSCSRPARRWSRRPTSCRSRCWRCCAS